MQVLGDLIRLPVDEGQGLPLPWWHRAPLGLSDKTGVFVALTRTGTGRPAPDLIVTVLNPSRWNRMYRLDCLKKDEPGVVADVLSKIFPLNIALAETVKVEKGDLHQVSLICEPAHPGQDTEAEVKRITAELKEADFNVRSERLPELPELAWHRAGFVEHGWVVGVKWQQELKEHHGILDQVDLRRVVASADTESRVLRYVFPRRGAMTVKIKHADEPGALATITSTIRTCDLNILSSFLRRGGGGGADAELVAVCEPDTAISASEIEERKVRLEGSILKISQQFRPQITISDGRDAEETIYIRHPEHMVARAPANLSGSIRIWKKELNARADRLLNARAEKADARAPITSTGVTPIFLSHRFSESTLSSETLDNCRLALVENDCDPVEAESSVAIEPVSIYMDVSSKLWTATAGIVLVIQEPDGRAISINLAHELGFLMGQGKPVLLLVEDTPACTDMMKSFVNIASVLYKPFRTNVGREHALSVRSIITTWIQKNVSKRSRTFHA